MTANEIARVQSYLRRALSNERIAISPPDPPGAPVELTIAGEQFGGLYRNIKRGISLGCPLSPLIGALYLKLMDDRMEKTGLFYVRFMDDWIVL